MGNLVTNTIVRVAKKGAFKLKKHAPEILTGLGIVSGLAATAFACRSTIKAQPILDEAKDEINEIHGKDSDPTLSYEEYPKEQVQKELTSVYIRTTGKLAKIYAPTIAFEALSVAFLIGSNALSRNRINATVAAFTALDTAFRNYRQKVKDAFGVDKELEVYHDVKALESAQTDECAIRPADCDADRSQVTVDGYSIYARCFDEYNPNWKDNAEFNLSFLRGCQRYLQACLERDGYLFLNDVYKELGFEATQAGQIVGWIYDPDREDMGDNVISFGLYDPTHGAALGDFINGNSNVVFLDFNVDGVIIDRI